MNKRPFILVMLLAAATTVSAMDVTVDQAVEMALSNNKSLQSSAIDVDMAREADAVSWNGFLPTVQTTANLTHANDVSSMYRSVDPDPKTSFSFGLTMSFSFNPALITNMELAKKKLAAGLITYAQAKAEMTLNVKKLFYAILLQEESLKIQETTLDNSRSRMEQAEDMYTKGYATELSSLQAQVSYENLKATTLKARQALAQQKDSFAFLLGMENSKDLNLVGAIETEFGDIDRNTALLGLAARYDVVSLDEQIDILSTQRKALDLQTWVPSVSLSLGWQPYLSDITANWGNADSWYDSGSSPSLTVAWNLTGLLPWSTQRQNAKTLEDNKRKLQISRSLAVDNARMEINKLLDTLDQAKEAIQNSERSIDLAQKSYDMTTLAYQAGTTELLDVRDSEAQLNQAKLGKLNEQYNYLSALLDLQYATQTTL